MHKPERLARWLPLTHDRVEGDQFQLTQEFISQMLAVHRAGVSVAANSLRAKIERLIMTMAISQYSSAKAWRECPASVMKW